MPQQFGNKTYNTFIRGLITEASELNFPVDASVDESNCVLKRDGSRSRRLGLDRETGSTPAADIGLSKFRSGRVVLYKWAGVKGDADRNFQVIQIAETLYFHDLASEPVSDGLKDFTVDLTPYAKPSSGGVGTYRCSFTTALGNLVVTSVGMNPIYITYDVGNDEVEVTEITIEFRDFEGVDDELANDEQPLTLSEEHHYNLLNQGWTPSSDFSVAPEADTPSPTDDVTGEPVLFFPQPYVEGVFNSYKDLYDLKLKDPDTVAAFFDTYSASEQETFLRRVSQGVIASNLINLTSDGSKPLLGLTGAQIVTLLDGINPNWDELIYGSLNPITAYQASIGKYPANNVQWWAAKDEDGMFRPMELAKIHYGTGLAPRGHYILRATEDLMSERERVSSRDLVAEATGGVLGPYTGAEAETIMLLHAENTTDSGPNSFGVVLNPSGIQDTDPVKFGSGSWHVQDDADTATFTNVQIDDDNEWTWQDGTARTLEFWVYFNSLPSSSAYWAPIIGHGQTSGNDRSWLFGYWPSGTHTFAPGFSMFWSKSGTEFIIDNPVSDSASLSTGQWYHIAVVWTGSGGRWNFYVDGCYTGFDVITNPVTFNNSTDTLKIGAVHGITGRTNALDANVDEVRWSSGQLYTHVSGCVDPPTADTPTESGEDNALFGPSTTAFFAGRVWWGGGNRGPLAGRVMSSPVLEGMRAIGRCYQAGDPTAEENSELVASDGLDIPIPGMGGVRHMHATDDFLVILADNGTWLITGGSTGFKSTDFIVRQISTVNCLGAGTVVDAEGVLMWWSATGIAVFGFNQDNGRPIVNLISRSTIQGYYDDTIPSISKRYAEAIYDDNDKRVVWLWRSDDPGDQTFLQRYDRALVFDLALEAFYPWTFTPLASNSPYVYGGFSTTAVGTSVTTANVLRGDDQLQDSNTDDIVIDFEGLTGRTILLKFFAVEDDGSGNGNYVFCELSNNDFLEWETADGTGIDTPAYAQAGYEDLDDPSTHKRAPTVHTFVRRSGDGGLTLRVRWEWADASASNRFSDGVECYRSNNFDTDGSAGFPVIVARHKVRGKGRAVSMRYESVEGKDFDLVGWSVKWAKERIA